MLTEYKKNRFYSNYDDNLYANDDIYQVYDFKTDDRWFIHKNVNNLYEDDLGVILNNLYERNGYLRQECSKLYKASQIRADTFFEQRAELSQLRYVLRTIQEIIDYKELPDLIEIAQLHATNPKKYYEILFTEPTIKKEKLRWIDTTEFINKINFDNK